MTTSYQHDRVLPLRKLIHLGGALFPTLYLVTTRQMMLAIALAALICTLTVEWARRRWAVLERMFKGILGPALRPDEQQGPTAGTWSMVGIVITLVLLEREVAIPAMLFAQIGDPVAEIVGRRWGRHRLPNSKSLEGSLGCFMVSAAIGLACSRFLPISGGIAVLGALVATVAEMVPLPVGDNLWMAPIAGLAMVMSTFVLG
jgi:dolichol kinase